MYTLVKDFQDYQFVYFWVENRKVVSPKLPTLEHAKEWFIELHFSSFKGKERRKFKLDRRQNTRSFYGDFGEEFMIYSPPTQGRRGCDKKVKVDLDYAADKVNNLRNVEEVT